MLEKFGLIESKTYGHDTFYYSRLEQPLVTFRAAVAEATFDGLRFKASNLEFYAKNDSRRSKAIKAYLKGRG